jgi:hypothetical protein
VWRLEIRSTQLGVVWYLTDKKEGRAGKTLLVLGECRSPGCGYIITIKAYSTAPLHLLYQKECVFSFIPIFSTKKKKKEKRPSCVTIRIPPPIANQVTVFLTVNAHKERDGFFFYLKKYIFQFRSNAFRTFHRSANFLVEKNQLENGETQIDKSIRNVRMSFNYLTCPRAALQLCERRRTGCAADR